MDIGEGKNDEAARFGEVAEEVEPFEADGVCLPRLASSSTYCSVALHNILTDQESYTSTWELLDVLELIDK